MYKIIIGDDRGPAHFAKARMKPRRVAKNRKANARCDGPVYVHLRICAFYPLCITESADTRTK